MLDKLIRYIACWYNIFTMSHGLTASLSRLVVIPLHTPALIYNYCTNWYVHLMLATHKTISNLQVCVELLWLYIFLLCQTLLPTKTRLYKNCVWLKFKMYNSWDAVEKKNILHWRDPWVNSSVIRGCNTNVSGDIEKTSSAWHIL